MSELMATNKHIPASIQWVHLLWNGFLPCSQAPIGNWLPLYRSNKSILYLYYNILKPKNLPLYIIIYYIILFYYDTNGLQIIFYYIILYLVLMYDV